MTTTTNTFIFLTKPEPTTIKREGIVAFPLTTTVRLTHRNVRLYVNVLLCFLKEANSVA